MPNQTYIHGVHYKESEIEIRQGKLPWSPIFLENLLYAAEASLSPGSSIDFSYIFLFIFILNFLILHFALGDYCILNVYQPF